MFPDSVESKRFQHERFCRENIDIHEFYRTCAYDDGIDEITRYMPWSLYETIQESKEFVDRTERKVIIGEFGESAFSLTIFKLKKMVHCDCV